MMAVKRASAMFIAGVAILTLVALMPAQSAMAQSDSDGLSILLKQARVDGMQMQAKDGGGEFMTRVSPSGYVRNISAPRATYLPVDVQGAKDPESIGRAFIQANRNLFIPPSAAAGFSTMRVRRTSVLSQVRFSQTYSGLPVYKAEVMLQTRYDKGVSYVLSDLMTDFSNIESGDLSLTPTLSAQDAVDAACGLFPTDDVQAQLPELMIFCPAVVGDSGQVRMVWQTVVTGVDGSSIAEEVLVNAHTGQIVLRFSLVHNFMKREVFDGSGYHADPGVAVRIEGGVPSLIPDVDDCYDYLGDAYGFYYQVHMRDSINNKGMTLSASVYYPMLNIDNAYWLQNRLYFASGYVADDVVGHEYTHGVTAYESMLINYGQSGAVGECFSDVWGEFIDLSNGVDLYGGNTRWLVGEDVYYGGGLRNMADPTEYTMPDKMSSPYYINDLGDPEGVHSNSAVGSKMCYLLTDGDTFNNFVVDGLGIETVAKLFYECQTNLLTAASDYADLSYAMLQAASYLGVNRDNVLHASQAVEIAPLESYVITYKGCQMDILEGVNIFVQDQTGKASIKIKRVNEFPSHVVLTDNYEQPRYGLVYLASRSIPNLNVIGDVRKLYSEITISDMVTTGTIKSITMKDSHLSRLTATAVGSVKMIETPVPGRSFVSIKANGFPVPPQYKRLKVKLVGLSVKAVDMPGQRVNVKVSSKKTQIFGQDRFVAEAGVTDVVGGDQVDVSVKGGNVYGWLVARGRLNKVSASHMNYSLDDGVKRVLGGFIGSPEKNFSLLNNERKQMSPLAYSVWLAAGDTSWLAMNNPKGALINSIRSTRGTMAFFVSGYQDTPLAPRFISTVNKISTGSTAKGNEGAWGKVVVAAGSKVGLSGDKSAIYDGRVVIVSNPAELQPVNDNFVDATTIKMAADSTVGYAVGSNVFASFEAGESTHGSNGYGASVWWAWTAEVTGWVAISALDSDFNTVLSVYEGTSVDNLTLVASNDDYAGWGKQSFVRLRATAGTTYHIAVDGSTLGDLPWVPSVTTDRPNTLGNIYLSWQVTPGPNNDNVDDAHYMDTPYEPGFYDSNFGATTEASEPNHTQYFGTTGHSVWFLWQWPTSGTLEIDFAADFDPILAVYSGDMYSSYTLIDTSEFTGDYLIVDVAADTPYWIALASYNSGVREGNYGLAWRLFPSNDDWQNAIVLPTRITTSTQMGLGAQVYEMQMSNYGASTQWADGSSLTQRFYDAPPYWVVDPKDTNNEIRITPYDFTSLLYSEPTPYLFSNSYRDPAGVENPYWYGYGLDYGYVYNSQYQDTVIYNSVWFEWRAPNIPADRFRRNSVGFTLSTYGSDFDTVVAVYMVDNRSTRSIGLSYQTVALNDDTDLNYSSTSQQGPVKTSEIFLSGDQIEAGATYLIEVGGVTPSDAGNLYFRFAELPGLYSGGGYYYDYDWWDNWYWGWNSRGDGQSQ